MISLTCAECAKIFEVKRPKKRVSRTKVAKTQEPERQRCAKETEVGGTLYRCRRLTEDGFTTMCPEHLGKRLTPTEDRTKVEVREMTEEDMKEYRAVFTVRGFPLDHSKVGFRISYGMSRMCLWDGSNSRR